MTKSLFVMITGRPNAGKSTLLNALLGEKVAIVSSKPQTTRCNITGVLTEGEDQFVFVDTPGLHKPRTLLGEYMMKSVGNASDGADVILFVTEACRRLNPAAQFAAALFRQRRTPVSDYKQSRSRRQGRACRIHFRYIVGIPVRQRNTHIRA